MSTMKKNFIMFALLSLIVTGIFAGCSAPAEEGGETTTATTGAAAGGEEGGE